jgi:hypothetical protein
MIKRFLFIVLSILLFSGFVHHGDEHEVIRVLYPEFVAWRYENIDFPLHRRLYDKQEKVIWPLRDSFLLSVDSCCWYLPTIIEYPVDSNCSHYSGFKVVESYKRLSSESWLRHKNGITDTIYENRSRIVSVDTIQVENEDNPGNYLIHIVKYYSVAPR